ncbi:MAG TPA: type II toxin-antitoxin system PemK/MazF family toxin [Drouetiella sp.]
MEFRDGQIWSTEIQNIAGSIRSTALIISPTEVNKKIKGAIVVCAKSYRKQKIVDGRLVLKQVGTVFKEDVLVYCDALATFPEEYFIDYIGTLTFEEMTLVRSEIKKMLAMD